MPRHTTQPALIPGGLSAHKGCTEGHQPPIRAKGNWFQKLNFLPQFLREREDNVG